MKDSVKFTLYEVLGFLAPGVVLLLGLIVVFWSCYMPASPLPLDPSNLTPSELSVLLAVSYYFGHVAQAVANLKFDRPKEVADLRSPDPADATIEEQNAYRKREAAENSKKALLGAAIDKAMRELSLSETQQLSPEWLERYMDEYVAQRGNVTDREIFTYREGFYRGMAVSSMGLAIALVIRWVAGPRSLAVSMGLYQLSDGQLAFLVAVAVMSSVLFHGRFRRFSDYRARRILLAFLALDGAHVRSGESKEK